MQPGLTHDVFQKLNKHSRILCNKISPNMPADELLHTSTFTCPTGTNYRVDFCPPTSGVTAGDDDGWRDGRWSSSRRRPRPPAAELPDLCIRGESHDPPPVAVHGLKRSILAEVYAAAHAEPPPPELGQPASLACSAAHLPVRSQEGERERGEGTGKKRGVRRQE
uniref:Uncharacterized protein n=1 Tax=Oryza barthii TaxID=65489 RepID=A0A0D3GEK7_9ORYZ